MFFILRISKVCTDINDYFLVFHVLPKFAPSSDKVSALKKFRNPVNFDKVRGYLGLVTYIGKFIPDLATNTNKFRNVLMMFIWKDEHTEEFGELKSK